jgi:2-hydroxyacyl-CoA lyase 1
MKVIQLDIAPEEIGHNKPTEVALVGPRVGPEARPRTGSGKAIPACARTGQLNKALAGRQWFHPKDTPRRQMIAQKAAENAAMIKPDR